MQFQTSLQSQLRDPKQKRLLIVALMLLATTGVVVWRMFFAGSSVLPTDTSIGDASNKAGSSALPPQGARASDLKRIKLDTEIIESDMFKDLRTYSQDIPVRVIEKGNVDPFRQRSVSLPQQDNTSPTSSPYEPPYSQF